jgi:hypothetical protein
MTAVHVADDAGHAGRLQRSTPGVAPYAPQIPPLAGVAVRTAGLWLGRSRLRRALRGLDRASGLTLVEAAQFLAQRRQLGPVLSS